MQFIKVFSGNDVIDLNPFLILKVEKLTEGMSFERAIITDVLGNKYRSLSSYEDFLTKVQSNR
jgi:hypothetical protein